MIDHNGKLNTIREDIMSGIGPAMLGRAITAKLYVSPNGSGADGSTWAKAYTTIQGALAAASTDDHDCTLILLAPHDTYYDIDTTGDPTYTGNYEIVGTHRLWALIRNTHASATSILKFTGKVSLRDLAIFQTGDTNGITITQGGFRIRDCGFNSEGLTDPATAIYIDGSAGLTRGGIIEDIQVQGHITYTKALHINASNVNEFYNMRIAKCLTGVHIEDAGSDMNSFDELMLHNCATGIDIDSGNGSMFNNIHFHGCTTNVDDAVGDSNWNNINAELDTSFFPDNFTGVTVATHANADTWTTVPVEIRSAAAATKPFKIVVTLAEGSAAEKFRIRLSNDAGAAWFADNIIEGEVNAIKRVASSASTATDHVFNKGTQIVAASKSESGGESVVVWIKLQEI